MATETSASGGSSGVSVDGILRTAAPAAPTSGQSIRQIITLGDGNDNLQLLSVDAGGAMKATVEGGAATYSAGIGVGLFAGDLLQIQGSASKIVKVKRIYISYGTGSTAGLARYSLIRRSTAATGGTSTAAAMLPYDENDPAATAVVTTFTAAPSVGVSVATLWRAELGFPNEAFTEILADFGNCGEKPICLRGTSDYLCVNVSNMTAGSPFTLVQIIWSEE